MTVLFFGDFGTGHMAAETALLEAVRAIGDPDPIVVTAAPGFTARCAPDVTCIAPGEAPPRQPSRIVLAGPIGRARRVPPLMALFEDAIAATPRANACLHNLSLPSGVDSAQGLRIAATLDGLQGSMRDHVTHLTMMRRGLRWFPALATFPERTLPHDDSLACLLPEGPAPLGLMLDASPHLLESMDKHPAAFRHVLGLLADRPVLPIPPSVRQAGDDSAPDPILGARQALLAFRPGQAPLLPALLDADWWLSHATPGGIGGLVKRCAMLVTTSDLGVLLAAATGVPCHIIGLSQDDAATRAGGTLAGALAPGSSFTVLR
ncbi:hypothetical protein ACQW02_24750 [Humitalea sp. 24SJ18S-53]|uniref:hypothetical protein n=1 Tax=Humitalea sp. 24SJ18S-53 TaxID=3422307 RepID=UPI003D67C417